MRTLQRFLNLGEHQRRLLGLALIGFVALS
jgi:hypothetical protein